MTGPAGGYQLRAGTAMPPLLLDDDEAIAIAVGLRTAAGGSVSGIEETAVRALVKLEQVLPSHLRRRVQALTAATQTLQVYGGPQVDPQMPDRAGRRLPRPRARALRLHRARPRRHAPRGRAALDGQRRPPLVPGRLRLRPRATGARSASTGSRSPPPPACASRPRELPAKDAAAYVSQSLQSYPSRYEARVTVRVPRRRRCRAGAGSAATSRRWARTAASCAPATTTSTGWRCGSRCSPRRTRSTSRPS